MAIERLYEGDQSKSYLITGLAIQRNYYKSFAYEKITVTDASVSNLTIPTNARYVRMVFETTDLGVAARFLFNKSLAVSTTDGLGISNGSSMDMADTQNLSGFQIIGTTGKGGTLYVEYFS